MITGDDVSIVSPPDGPAEGEVVHPLACFHRKWRVDLVRAQDEYSAAVHAVDRLLTRKQRLSPAWDELDAAFGMLLCAQQDHLVAVLAAHFPGIAPAIRAIAYHADDDMDGTCIASCCWPNGRPEGV
jgi:hypothetical protein